MSFEFYTSTKIIFGNGKFSKAAEVSNEYADNYFIVSGQSMIKSGHIEELERKFDDYKIKYTYYCKPEGEPTAEMIENGVKFAADKNCNGVIAIGGGSVIDTGKAIASLITNGGSVIDYIEGVGRGKKIIKESVPFIAVPTTSGTGSEVTKNAVIISKEDKFKKSMRSDKMYAKAAIIDPMLTVSLPSDNTAASGMDALTQLIESYVSRKSEPLTDALSLYGIKLAGKWLKRSYIDAECLHAREFMSLASLISGICIANSGLGAVHGISSSLGAHYGISHGLSCGILLPYIMNVNFKAEPEKFWDIGNALTGNEYKNADDSIKASIDFINQLKDDMSIPIDLKCFKIDDSELEVIAQDSKGSSMSGNPVELNNHDIEDILRQLI